MCSAGRNASVFRRRINLCAASLFGYTGAKAKGLDFTPDALCELEVAYM